MPPLGPSDVVQPGSWGYGTDIGQSDVPSQQQAWHEPRWTKRVKSTVLDTFPVFASGQHSYQLQQQAAAKLPGGPDRQQLARRAQSSRDQALKPKIRRIPCLEDDRPSTSYDPEYLEHCYSEQHKGAADWCYLTTVQRDGVDAHKRLVLIDWLVEVVDEFKLSQTTLFLAVNLVDRYLSRRPVPRSALQLLGVTALWLASKFEEVYPPTLGDFVDVTQHSCSPAQLIDMEAHLLRELGFTLMVPTAMTFLELYLPAAAANAADADAYLSAAIDGDGCDSDTSAETSSSGASYLSRSSSSSANGRMPCADVPSGPRAAPRYPYPIGGPCASMVQSAVGGCVVGAPVTAAGSLAEFPRRVAHLAEYLAELSLLSPECLRYLPSLVAAAALNLACSLLDAPPGTRVRLAPAAEAAAAHVGPGGQEMLRACMGELRRMFVYAAHAPRPPAVKAKYCSPKRHCVATMPVPRWVLEA